LLEYDRGDYADLPTRYTQEELKKRTRLKGGGAKLKDEVLEERLVNYYNQLQEELYPSPPSYWLMSASLTTRNFLAVQHLHSLRNEYLTF